MNYPVSRSDIYVAKGVTNEIWFYLKDIDLKAVVLSETIVLRVSDRDAGTVLLTLTMTLSDAAKARYVATIPPSAISDLDPGFYSFAVTRRASDGSERLLYADRSRTEFGVIEVRNGPVPPETAAVEVDVDDLYPRDGYLFSGAFPGPLQVGSMEPAMTVAVYGAAFTGSISIQGTLDLSPSDSDSEWFDMADTDFANLTGSSGVTVEGSVTFVRFRISDRTAQTLAASGLPTPSGPNGFLKIAFRA